MTASDTAPRPTLVRSGLLSVTALVALGLTRLVHGSLVSRATDQETYGRVGSLIALTTIASLLLPAGVASAAAKFIPFQHGRGDDAAAGAVHRFLSRLGLAGGLALGAGAGVAAALIYHEDALQAAALCLAFSVYSVQKAALFGVGEVGAYARLELACGALSIAATVVVVSAGWTVYLLPLTLGYAVFSAAAWWRLRAHRARAGGSVRPLLREMLAFVALACLGTVCASGFLQGTQLLAGHFALPTEVAYFAAAVTLVAPAYFLPRALGMVLFPAMARAHGAGDLAGVRRQADVSTRALVVVLAPVFAAGLLVAREVLIAFGGSRYAAGAVVLQLILAATYLAVAQVAAVNALSSGAHARIPVFSAVAGCAAGLAAVTVLGGPFGAVGVGLAYLLGTAITAAVPIGTVWRQHLMPWRGPVVRAVSVLAVALVAARLLDGAGLSGGGRTAADLAAAAAAVLAGGALLRPDLRRLWRDARPPAAAG